MKTSDLLFMCYENLRRRKFRTMLTVIGVVIGTAAIISMISFALGIKKTADSFISSWGDLSIITVYSGKDAKIDDSALSSIVDIDGVKAATPFWEGYYFQDGRLYAGKNNRYETDIWNIVGVYPSSLEDMGYSLESGSIATTRSNKKIFMLFGSEIPYSFKDSKRSEYNNRVDPFPDPLTGEVPPPFFDPLTEKYTLSINYDPEDKTKTLDYNVVVTGILKGDDANSRETRQSMYMDVDDLAKIAKEYQKTQKIKTKTETGYSSAKVKIENIKDVSSIEKQIKDMGFETYSLENERQNALKQTQNLQLILGALGGVSLIVAAISIANTMIMSVYERTREIGVMKVLGCFVGNIRSMFLIEAAMIGFIGGLIGVFLSFIISFILNYYSVISQQSGSSFLGGISYMITDGSKLSVIPWWLVVVGLVFSTSIGVIAGLYPAMRAVKISALEAIRQA